jgi:hypothetical protein
MLQNQSATHGQTDDARSDDGDFSHDGIFLCGGVFMVLRERAAMKPQRRWGILPYKVACRNDLDRGHPRARPIDVALEFAAITWFFGAGFPPARSMQVVRQGTTVGSNHRHPTTGTTLIDGETTGV